MTPWNFRSFFQPSLSSIAATLNADTEFITASRSRTLEFLIEVAETKERISVSILSGVARVSLHDIHQAEFTLSARTQDWQEFFAPVPKQPYQSYWGILRVYGQEPGVGISGDISAFS